MVPRERKELRSKGEGVRCREGVKQVENQAAGARERTRVRYEIKAEGKRGAQEMERKTVRLIRGERAWVYFNRTRVNQAK